MTNKLIILAYHGITTKKEFQGIENYSRLNVLRTNFLEHMRYIKKNCTVLSMDEVVECYVNRKYPKNAASVTFDDGYKNNYYTACPILDEFKIPATFYISTGNYLLGQRILYSGAIERMINSIPEWDENLKIKTVNIYKKLIKKSSSLNEVHNIIRDFAHCWKIKAEQLIEDYDYNLLDGRQIISMDKNKIFTIGAHSHNHLNLINLIKDDLVYEIKNSLLILSNLLKKQIKHFSYPHGKHSDEIINILKDSSIICCPLPYPGSNTIKIDLFHLKRYTVGYCQRQFPYKELIGG